MGEERRKLWLYLYPDEPQQQSAIETIEEVRILKILFPKLNIDSTENKSTLLAVAWQKRCRDDLQQGTPWSSWFAISEDEYNHHIDHPASNCQVRALWTYDENEQKKDISNQESMSFSDTNINKNSETLTNAKKLFGTSD